VSVCVFGYDPNIFWSFEQEEYLNPRHPVHGGEACIMEGLDEIQG
jgi:hypothetical protein